MIFFFFVQFRIFRCFSDGMPILFIIRVETVKLFLREEVEASWEWEWSLCFKGPRSGMSCCLCQGVYRRVEPKYYLSWVGCWGVIPQDHRGRGLMGSLLWTLAVTLVASWSFTQISCKDIEDIELFFHVSSTISKLVKVCVPRQVMLLDSWLQGHLRGHGVVRGTMGRLLLVSHARCFEKVQQDLPRARIWAFFSEQ